MDEKQSFLYHHVSATSSEELLGSQERPPLSFYRRKAPSLHLASLYVVICALLAALIISIRSKPVEPFLQVYSPANAAIEYEEQTIEGALPWEPINSIYHGNSSETDDAWNELYQTGVSLLDDAEAKDLPQWTETVPGHPDKHLIILNVFHELHCLNYIRKSLYPETYGILFRADGTRDEQTLHHLNHCVNFLRQVLTCYSDPGVVYFRDGPLGVINQPFVKRMCRKYDSVKHWAEQHRAMMTCEEVGIGNCHSEQKRKPSSD